ncbi:MAG: radical SAM protein [Sphaerochaetaceae bacterium]|nr:radical SAM protein [Sphaerochaetaceae bacterium]
MNDMRYIYGPVPSRRLGISLGISPIPKKTCNYSCIYCQLGRTDKMSNNREMFFPVGDILSEFDAVVTQKIAFDVITIVGEGEPTLYLGLGKLIGELQQRCDKPIAVITNGALLYDKQVREDLQKADIVLPTLDACSKDLFRKINRPYKTLTYEKVLWGLQEFSKDYRGQLWIEIMLVEGYNDDERSLKEYLKMLSTIHYDKLYVNTPVRPPAESRVKAVDHEKMAYAAQYLGGISIDLLVSQGFHSEIKNDYDAVLSIIKRHPMNQFEIEGFLNSRKCKHIEETMKELSKDPRTQSIDYKGFVTYRLK